MNKVLLFFLFIVLNLKAQINIEAFDNYNKSTYQNVSSTYESDVIIIFDRTYIEVDKTNKYGESKVEVLKTIHRKIKINSLYGLEKYNRLYIQTLNDLNVKIEFVDCKAKTLKKGNLIIHTASSDFVTTTLPANTPFYYKIQGEVKMLAIKDVNIGDEIEYIFTTREIVDYNPDYYYKTERVSYSYNDFCIEKSLFLKAEDYNIRIWPYNFNNGNSRKTDYSYKEGKKITLNNIKPRLNEIYSNSYFDEPYITYIINKSTVNKEDTWGNFAKDFKPSRRKTKKRYIFDGKTIIETLEEIELIKETKGKYQYILEKINQPLEDNIYVYNDVKDEIDIAWKYAQIISKALSKIQLPINFHFVVNKNYGKLDKSYVTLYQFSNIICSFLNDDGTIHYFSLLEPYSNLNDIREEFQGTECFTIAQDEFGKRTYSFNHVPKFDAGLISKHIDVNLLEVKKDTLKLNIKEVLSFTGHSWINIKPLISHVINDSVNVNKRLKYFVKNQLVKSHEVDSIYNIEYKKQDTIFSVNYEYNKSKIISSESKIIDLSLGYFIKNNFYTPYSMRGERIKNGYLNNENNVTYFLDFNLNEKFKWIENKAIKTQISNSFGVLKTDYLKDKVKLSTSFNLKIEKDEFKPTDWEQILDLRDAFYDYLNSKFYFKKIEF